MISFERFLELPTGQVAALVKAGGQKVCVFPVNGTRRWFMLEHADKIGDDFIAAYMDESIRNHVALCASGELRLITIFPYQATLGKDM